MHTHPLRNSLLAAAFLFFNSLPFFFMNGIVVENISRSAIAFVFIPLWIIFANKHSLWFHKSLRWVVTMSHKLAASIAVFTIGVLLSYEALNLIPSRAGFIFHLIILSLSSLIYWAPLLLRCTFYKERAFSDRAVYFAITTALFFIYHQAAFLYYKSSPTFAFMAAGLTVMIFTLLHLCIKWHQSEKTIDRSTVEGYIRPLEKKS
ncbi:hypothetical protein ACFQMN_01460 [Halobacillus campisalis]|uniref:Uncharacterized protein n=1 Tax=Halobacillus campisalis TaxID=435909 RepID=A0ABW2K054_9BACI|nr:hypothetical protein [Halobacillus campisalis]